VRWMALLALVTAAACAEPQRVSLTDLSSDLQLRSLPLGAAVTLDGQTIGKTPMDITLAAGRSYDFTFSLKGFASRSVGGTRERLLHLGSGQLGVVLLPQGFVFGPPPSFDAAGALAAAASELGRRKDWGHAAEFWARVLLLQPRDARAHRGMGSALAKLGRDEEAIREYEQYLFLAPDADDADRVRHAVDAFRGGVEMRSVDN
jgi:tetratricopeptide (TPR) repeat protein